MLRYLLTTTILSGQSQAIHLSGSGETAEPGLTLEAANRLGPRLTELMPGTTNTVKLKSNGGNPATYSAKAATCLVTWPGEAEVGWWNPGTNALDAAGIATRDYVLESATGANRLGVFVHYCNTQDAAATNFDLAQWRAFVQAYYAAIHTACAPSFGDFVILPVCNSARPTGSSNLGSLRATFDAMAGYGAPIAGVSRLPYVLRPVYPTGWVEIGAYVDGSGDFTHTMRSTARRAVEAIANRIAGYNGAVTPLIEQPRLCRAVQVNGTTVRAFIVSPKRLPIKLQGTTGFALTVGSISATGTVDNSAVASTGYATIDLTVSGLTASSRLTQLADNQGGSSFANGTTAPRGNMQRIMFADPTPGATLTITDAYEDVVLANPALMIAQHQTGVPVELL